MCWKFNHIHVVKGYAKRKPDVVLIPEKDGDDELTMRNVKWYHMLSVIEFKKNSEAEKKKR